MTGIDMPPTARGCRGATGVNGGYRQSYNVRQRVLFNTAELRLPLACKNLTDRPPGPGLNLRIKVQKRAAEQLGESPPDTALAASHKSCQ